MTGPDLVLTNARVLAQGEIRLGSVRAREGLIVDVDSGASRAAGIDCEGDYLLPGLVELHTDHFEKQLMPRPEVAWPALSALIAHDAQLAASGITTVFDAIAVGNTHDKPERAEILAKALAAIAAAQNQGALRAEHWIHIRCEVSHPQMLDLFSAHASGPGVKLVSLMDHTPGARQYADVARFRFHVQKSFGHSAEEIEAFISARQSESERNSPAHRSAIAQEARRRGISLASHDDGTEEHIKEAVSLGVTIAEFPTTLAAARAARRSGLKTIMGAPNVVRGGSHSGNVAAVDLARAGLLDALSSDYMPLSLLEAPFVLTREAGLSLPDAVALVTRNPARMANLGDRGEVAPGLRADFLRVRQIMGTPIVLGVWRQGRRVA